MSSGNMIPPKAQMVMARDFVVRRTEYAGLSREDPRFSSEHYPHTYPVTILPF